ncbi:hypothetical protein FRC04_004044 [Tulasnella sp. 424]|nr:hypothetical protein FRC04_004044 [Tulasnella sp. 424]
MKVALSSLIVAALTIKPALGVAFHDQCGGIGYTGDTSCDAGLVCTYQNDYYSQCLPGTGTTTNTTATKTSTTTTKTIDKKSSDSTPAATGSFTNPIKDSNGSDPFMVYDCGYYYLLTTTWSNIQITRATTIAGLKTATPKVVWTEDSVAARCCNYWAPEVHKIGNTARLEPMTTRMSTFFKVVRPPTTRTLIRPNSRPPTLPTTDGTILIISGTSYFVFFGKDTTASQALWIAPLTNAWTADDRSLISHPLESWERNGWYVNEVPQPLHHNGAIYLTYSASLCSTPYYSLGLLKYNGGDPTSIDSWITDLTSPPLTATMAPVTTVSSPLPAVPNDSVTCIVYHATADSDGDCVGNRYTMIQPMSRASEDATPIFPVPAALSDSIPAYP